VAECRRPSTAAEARPEQQESSRMADDDVPPEGSGSEPKEQTIIFYHDNPSLFQRYYEMFLREWWQERSALIDEDTPAWRDRRGPEHAVGHAQDMCFAAAEAARYLVSIRYSQTKNEIEGEMLLWIAGMLKDLYLRRIPDVLTSKPGDPRTGKPKRGAREIRETLLTNLAPADAFVLLVENGYIPGKKKEAVETICGMYGIEPHVFSSQKTKTRPHHEADVLRELLDGVAPEDRWCWVEQYLPRYAARYRASYLPSEAKAVVAGGGRERRRRRKKAD
jgi:hypothetical protein